MMPRLPTLFAILALAACDGVGSSTCAGDHMTVNDGGPVIRGSGNVKTEMRSVTPFTAIRLSSLATVVIERTGAETLTVTGDDNLLSLFTSEVRDGTLSLSVEKGKSFEGKMPAWRVTVRELVKVELEGSGAISASKLGGDALSISVSGSGKLSVAGQVNDLAVAVRGSGTADAARLMAQRAKVVVMGSGELTVNARDELEAKVRGSGSIWYLGSPNVNLAVSGSGSIKKKSM